MAKEKLIWTPDGCHHENPNDHDMSGESFNDDELEGECYCPVCNSTNIEWEDDDFDVFETVYRNFWCKDCRSEFSIRYEWTGAYVLKDGRYEEE